VGVVDPELDVVGTELGELVDELPTLRGLVVPVASLELAHADRTAEPDRSNGISKTRVLRKGIPTIVQLERGW
jgi:hypothetical protein